jgi:hypothetical protein
VERLESLFKRALLSWLKKHPSLLGLVRLLSRVATGLRSQDLRIRRAQYHAAADTVHVDRKRLIVSPVLGWNSVNGAFYELHLYVPHRERLTPTEMNLQPGFATTLTT